jgi:predicted PurR-regulated permease PerM
MVWISPVAWFIALVFLLYFFNPISTVLLGTLAACIIACTLHPLMDYIPGPRGSDVAILGIGMIAILAGVVFLLSWPLATPISRAVSNWDNTQRLVNEWLQGWGHRLRLPNEPTIQDLILSVRTFLLGEGGTQLLSSGASVALGILVSLVFTLVGSLFLLSEPPERLIDPALRMFSARNRPIVQAVLEELAPRFRRWVIGTLTGMCVVFIASSIGYSVIGLREVAIPLGLLAGFAEIVPTVGPAVACVIAALFAVATRGGTTAVGVLIVYAVIQAIEAYAILPMIMKGAVNIHPAVTLFSVVLWGKIFGVAGLMLAIPINLTIWTFFDHFRFRPRDLAEVVLEPSEDAKREEGG